MSRALTLGVGLAGLLAAAACGGGSDGTSKPAAPAAAPAAPDAPAAPAATTPPAATEAELSTLDAIPTTDELEQRLTETVTDENADAEFEKLQKELEGEEGG
jgi:hypothetical protein